MTYEQWVNRNPSAQWVMIPEARGKDIYEAGYKAGHGESAATVDELRRAMAVKNRHAADLVASLEICAAQKREWENRGCSAACCADKSGRIASLEAAACARDALVADLTDELARVRLAHERVIADFTKAMDRHRAEDIQRASHAPLAGLRWSVWGQDVRAGWLVKACPVLLVGVEGGSGPCGFVQNHPGSHYSHLNRSWFS